MRRRNWRIIIAGFLLIVLALGFFFFMLTIAPRSTDPVLFTQLIGQTSGVAGSFGIVLIIIGLIGKKV